MAYLFISWFVVVVVFCGAGVAPLAAGARVFLWAAKRFHGCLVSRGWPAHGLHGPHHPLRHFGELQAQRPSREAERTLGLPACLRVPAC